MAHNFSPVKSDAYMASMIDWNLHAGFLYVCRHPEVLNSLLYLTEDQYYQKQAWCLARDLSLICLATPSDTSASVRRAFPMSLEDIDNHFNSFKSPLGAVNFSRVRLFDLISGWKLSGSMIDFKGNLDVFFTRYATSVAHWTKTRFSGSLLNSYRKLGIRMYIIQQYRGINQVIIRLKVSTIVILHYLSGNPISHTNDLGQRITLVNGLPKWIPCQLRQVIRSKSIPQIRILLSVLSSYKGIKGVYKDPDLSSITAPKFFKPLKGSESLAPLSVAYSKYLPFDMLSDDSEIIKTRAKFWRFINPRKIKLDLTIDPENLPINLKAGPNCSVSFLGAAVDAVGILAKRDHPLLKFVHYILYRSPDSSPSSLGDSYKRVLEIMTKLATDTSKSVRNPARAAKAVSPFTILDIQAANAAMVKESVVNRAPPRRPLIPESWSGIAGFVFEPSTIKFGKLAIKLEAAGKVRVFAIIDYWTQVFLEPIHKSLFSILKDHPMDATFDQLGRVESFMKQPHTYIASFDLKSATDLIPQSLYVDVMAPWFDFNGQKPNLAQLWMNLLVDRDFHFRGRTYRYTRGQPMGALSSWASLALIHHYLVFLSAYRVNFVDFRDYLVLGDDIVIGNKTVALEYLKVCTEYGIVVGLPKSFQSNNAFFQFASQDILDQTNISPISLKEVLSIAQIENQFKKLRAVTALGPRVEFVNRLIRKGFIESNILSALRATMSFSDWRKCAQYLSRGVLPPRVIPVLLGLLTTASRLEVNKFSVSQLMGSLRGDMRMLTGNSEYSIQEQNLFVDQMVEKLSVLLKDSVQDAMSRVSKLGSNRTLQSHPLASIFSDSLQSRVTRNLMDIMKIQAEWKDLRTQVLADIEHNKIVYLLWDGESLDAHISYLNIHHIFGFIRNLEQIRDDIDLMAQALDAIQAGSAPNKVKTFLSFMSKQHGKI